MEDRTTIFLETELLGMKEVREAAAATGINIRPVNLDLLGRYQWYVIEGPTLAAHGFASIVNQAYFPIEISFGPGIITIRCYH